MANIVTLTLAEEYGTKYTRTLNTMLQQMESDLRPWFTPLPGCKGERVDLPFFGKNEMRPRTQRSEKIARRESLFGNRQMLPRAFYNATTFNNDDKLYNTDIDFTLQNIINEDRYAIARQLDEVLMGVTMDKDESSPTFGEYVKLTAATTPASVYDAAGGLLGTNYVGKNGTQLEDLADADDGNDKSTNVVPVDFRYSGTKENTGWLLDKLVRAIELLKKRHAHVKGKNTAVIALTARQMAEIQMWERSQSRDYGFGDLVDGFQNRILGVHILETETLPVVNVGTAEAPKLARINPVFVKEHALMGIWQDAQVRIDHQLQEYVSDGQVVTTCAMGAARKYKESVIQVQSLETTLR